MTYIQQPIKLKSYRSPPESPKFQTIHVAGPYKAKR